MKKYFSKLLCMALAVIMVVGLVPFTATPAEAAGYGATVNNGVNHYSASDWKLWSQGGSKYQMMYSGGCNAVSQCKLMKEAGYGLGDTFNPDVYYEWCAKNEKWGDGSPFFPYAAMEGFTNKAITYLIFDKTTNEITTIKKNYTYAYSTKGLSSDEVSEKIMSFLKEGYYVILGLPRHYNYVLREASLSKGVPIISDTSHAYKDSPDEFELHNSKYDGKVLNLYVCKVDPTKVCAYAKEHNGDHNWNEGICSDCGTWSPSQFQSSVSVPTGSRSYKVLGNISAALRTGPYSECKKVTLAPNTTLTVTDIIVNARGMTWYKVANLPGCSGYNYIYSERVEKASETAVSSKLEIKPQKTSITITQGNVCPVLGKITTNGTLDTIIATLDGKQYAKIHPGNQNTLDLKKSDVNNLLIGASLSVGSHTLVINATDSFGGNRTVTIPITVNASTKLKLYAPTISYYNCLLGGKFVVIKQNPGNPAETKIAYSLNGGKAILTSENSIEFITRRSVRVTAYATKDGKNSSTVSTRGIPEEDAIDSDETEKFVVVEKLDAPEISVSMTPSGASVSLGSSKSAEIYYTLYGGAEQRYLQPISLTYDTTITAYCKLAGYENSETTTERIIMSVPDAPQVILLAGNITTAQGSAATVGWKAVKNAASYTFRAYLNGELKETKDLTGNSFAYELQEAGNYSFTVSATNAFGTSAESAPVNVTSKEPCTVRFVDWDGSVLSEQTVDYGTAATEPSDPERSGHDFLYWEQDSNCVTKDMTVTPVYKIRSYRVTFEDQDGNRIGNTTTVQYNGSVTAPDASAVPCLSGYKFIGWNVQPESASSSCQIVVRDGKYVLEGVDSGVTVKAIVAWGDSELPVSATITSAQRNDDSANGNYVVNVHLNGTPSQYTTALVRVSLKTSAGKMVATEAHTVGLPAGTVNQNEVFTLKYSGTASIAEVVALGYNGDYATGSAYAPADTKNITVISEYVYGPWSEWSTTRPNAIEGREIEQKVQYNTRSKSTKTSSNASESGWELEKTESKWVTGNWSTWSDTAYYATTTSNYKREVQKQSVFVKKQYQYTHYYNTSTGNTSPVKYSGWIGPHYCGNSKGDQWIDFQLEKTGRTSNADGSVIYRGYCPVCGKTTNFYHETTQDIYKTQYRYRDSNLVYTYYYYRWGSWSGWTDTPASSDSTHEVSTRTVYRYRDKNVPTTAVISGEEDDSGTPHSVNGVLPVDSGTDLQEKIALIMVYKGKNSDPNESQLEYVGQTVIGAGNSYSFNFRTREEPTFITGDFVISLSVQGSTGLVNIGTIPAPKRQHYVVFLDNDNNPIPVYADGVKITQSVYDEKNELLYSEAQIVDEGCNAIVPEAPAVEGKYFTNWSGNTTNIADDLVFAPHYENEHYASVYIDWVNESVNVYEYDLGDEGEAPVVQQKDGYTFLGWVEDKDSGTEHVKVYFATYEVETYQVDFMRYDGTVLSTQTVTFGGVAVPPEAPEIENMIFLGWSTSTAWWDVSADLEVAPIYIYEDTAEVPTPEVDTFDMDNPTVALFAEEDAIIYFTTDGSEPDIETAEIYKEPIPLTEETDVRAIAVVPGKNVSETMQVNFDYATDEYTADMPDLVEIGTYTVNATPGGETTLQLNMSESAGLVAYLFTVECDRGVFYLDYDEETGLVATPGKASQDGMMFCAPYEDLGYQILWFSQNSATTAGELFSITLHVSDEAEAGAYPITVSYSPSNTVTAEDVEASADGMSVFFGGSGLLGDVSGDGFVTTVDVVRIARYLIDDFALTQAQIKLADVTGDGDITAADLVRLARYIVGLAVLG